MRVQGFCHGKLCPFFLFFINIAPIITTFRIRPGWSGWQLPTGHGFTLSASPRTINLPPSPEAADKTTFRFGRRRNQDLSGFTVAATRRVGLNKITCARRWSSVSWILKRAAYGCNSKTAKTTKVWSFSGVKCLWVMLEKIYSKEYILLSFMEYRRLHKCLFPISRLKIKLKSELISKHSFFK